jgi:hypothetical protein
VCRCWLRDGLEPGCEPVGLRFDPLVEGGTAAAHFPPLSASLPVSVYFRNGLLPVPTLAFTEAGLV